MKEISTKDQADILTKYLIKRTIDDSNIYQLYNVSVMRSITNDESKLIQFAFTHPRCLPLLDAGLIFIRPTSELRRRMYIMFSILEASPDYVDMFLPKKVNLLELLGILFSGIRAVLRALVGILFIKLKKL